jgi:choloylglycine hydrolase
MEWGADLHSQIWLYPRGQSRSSQSPLGKIGATWVSQYGYLGVDCNNMPWVVDGLNEKGLSVGLLWLPGSIYQAVPTSEPSTAISVVDLGHYLLGNCKTVEEVKAKISNLKVWAPSLKDWGGIPTAHLALHDAQGNSAVVEFTDGQQKYFENRCHVLTNAPTFDWQETNLRNYIHLSPTSSKPVAIGGSVLSAPGQGAGFLGLPGDWTPPSRFVRTTAMLAFAKQTNNAKEGVNLALHVLNAVDIPLGDIRSRFDSFEHSDYTQWIVVKDLTNSVLYFRSYDNLNLHYIDLKKLHFEEGNKPQKIAPISGGLEASEIVTKHI